jgi:hypothetical protein
MLDQPAVSVTQPGPDRRVLGGVTVEDIVLGSQVDVGYTDRSGNRCVALTPSLCAWPSLFLSRFRRDLTIDESLSRKWGDGTIAGIRGKDVLLHRNGHKAAW